MTDKDTREAQWRRERRERQARAAWEFRQDAKGLLCGCAILIILALLVLGGAILWEINSALVLTGLIGLIAAALCRLIIVHRG